MKIKIILITSTIFFYLILFCAALTHSQGTSFTESSHSLGIAHSYDAAGVYGGAATFYDFDMDGWDDITLATGFGDSICFYKNVGGSFLKLPSFIDFTGEAKSVLWVDFDNDGDKDLYVSSYLHTNRLYKNDGTMNFTDITAVADLPLDSFPSFGAVWADYDKDGWLDLYFVNRSAYGSWTYTNYLYRNRQDGTFENVTITAGVGDGIRSPLCAGFFDYNKDGNQDLYISCEQFGDANSLYQNSETGVFTDVSIPSSANIDIEAMCVAVADYNNDSHLDVYVTNRLGGNKLLKNSGSNTFAEVSVAANVEMNSVGWSSWFFDADNDGFQDLYVSGSCPGSLLKSSAFHHNNGNGSFTEPVGIGFDADTMRSYSNSIGDVNNDGFPDILVLNVEPDSSQLWLNNGNTNRWLKLLLQGTVSNRDGIGAWIDIYVNSKHYVRTTHCGLGFLGQGSSSVFIGLGTDEVIDSLVVRWPSGIIDAFYNLTVDQTIQIIEGEVACANPIVVTSAKQNVDCMGLMNGSANVYSSGGSPPYTYVWNTLPEVYSAGISNVSGGIYNCTITDSKNCQKQTQINIFEPNALFVNAILNFPQPGDINLLVSGGIAPYTYNWSTGAVTEDVFGLGPGFYFVQVTDRNGCARLFTLNL